jgi:excisionase family DNA binding protein
MPANPADYISTREAANRLGVSTQWVARMCASGAMRAIRVGKIWLVSTRSVEVRRDRLAGKADPAPAAD